MSTTTEIDEQLIEPNDERGTVGLPGGILGSPARQAATDSKTTTSNPYRGQVPRATASISIRMAPQAE